MLTVQFRSQSTNERTCVVMHVLHNVIRVFIRCLCDFWAYHGLFNLAVDGHNASTRGTAEEKKEEP